MDKTSNEAVFNYKQRDGMSKSEIAEMFSKGAAIYDDGWAERGYVAYKDVARKTAEFLPEKSNVKILDVAAGTGLLAQELWRHGFRQIDGLDPAEGMKDEAMKKKIYTEYFVEFMTGETTPGIQTDSYDAVVSSGGFGNGLMPCDALFEMIRVVKPDGLLCFIMSEWIFSDLPEYKGRLAPLMAAMEEDGVWQLLDKEQTYNNKTINIFTYIVKKSVVPEGAYDRILAKSA